MSTWPAAAVPGASDRPLRIGIDAKALDQGPASSRVVVRGLLGGLARTAGPHTISVIRDRRHLVARTDSGFDEIGVWTPGPSLLSNLTTIPWVARRSRLDAVVYQTFSPVRVRHTVVAFTHDIINLDHPEYFTPLERLYFAPRTWLLGRADWVTTISDHELARLRRHGLADPARSGVVHNGVERRFRPITEQDPQLVAHVRSRYGLPERFLLHVGRLNVRKNLPHLLEAVRRSTALGPGCPLVLVGERDRGSVPIEPLIDQFDVRDRVRVLGALPDADLAAVLGLASALAFVSLDEGFGLPPLEAMASGTPVIATATGALPEVCGDAAYYVDPTDPGSIGSGIDAVLGDEHLRASLRDRGLANASRFSWDVAARDLITQIEAATAASPPTTRGRDRPTVPTAGR